MESEIPILPFRVHRLWYRVYGLLRLEPEHLYIELQTIENITGVLRSRIRTLAISLTDITAINLEKGWRGSATLHIRTSSLKILKRFPGSHSGECQLYIRRRDWLLAEAMCHQIELHQTEQRLKQLEQNYTKQLGESPAMPDTSPNLWALARRHWVKIFPPETP